LSAPFSSVHLAVCGSWRDTEEYILLRLGGTSVSLRELETAVTNLPASELATFTRWFEEYLAEAWDRRIEEDIQAGRLEEAGRRADAEFEAGRCKPL